MHFRAFALAAVLLVAALAGCTKPEETARGDENTSTTPPPTGIAGPAARFQVTSLEILHSDGRPGDLYEDDGTALVRYSVKQPDDASRAETAFVTYLLNGRIIDTQQLKLDPGQNKTFERKLGDVRDNRTIRVEVRAGSSSASVTANVKDWPRAGQGALAFGPLEIRADYGFMEQDGRTLINLTLKNVGPEQEIDDFRAKMLCVRTNGTIRSTNSVRLDAPTMGNSTGVDALIDSCGTETHYGLEFKAKGANDTELIGRLLLVPVGWRPPVA